MSRYPRIDQLPTHVRRQVEATLGISSRTRDMPPSPSQDTGEGGIVAPAKRQAARTGDESPARVQRLWVGAIAPSINGLYTMHPMTRSSRAKQFKALVVTMCRQQGLQPVERYPVTVRVVCHFGPGRRRYDWENLALSAKWTGDGLREAGILHNDSPDYIAAGTIESRRTESESYMEYFIHEENQ